MALYFQLQFMQVQCTASAKSAMFIKKGANVCKARDRFESSRKKTS